MWSLWWRPSVVPIRPSSYERAVVGLADVVHAAQFEHQVVDLGPRALDHGEAVVARIDVEEVGDERVQNVVAEPEAEHVLVERHRRLDLRHVEHAMADPEWTGAEAGDGTSRLERIARDLRPAECLEHVAGGIFEGDAVS